MPILRREPDAIPDHIFELPADVHPWHVVHVRSRQEKCLTRRLRTKGIVVYLPQREQRRERRGRLFTSWLPLFPGYVFFCGDRQARLEALRSNVVVQFLEVHDQALLREELRQLYRLQASGAMLVPSPAVNPGDAVQIREGLFRDYRGVVMRTRGEDRLIVSITALRQSVAVELDVHDVRRVPVVA